MKKKRVICFEYSMLVVILMYVMKWLVFHMQLVLSIDTWKNQVKSMEMGASVS